MRNKSGLHPYDAGVFFILRGAGKRWPIRTVSQVSGWQLTRMLAHQFDKPIEEVAREIFDRAHLMEEGKQWRTD